jgi:hypothetical protein
MTLAMTNLQDGGRNRNKPNKCGKNQNSRNQNKGGSGIGVPAGLLLMNQYLKARKSRKASKKSSKKSSKKYSKKSSKKTRTSNRK